MKAVTSGLGAMQDYSAPGLLSVDPMTNPGQPRRGSGSHVAEAAKGAGLLEFLRRYSEDHL